MDIPIGQIIREEVDRQGMTLDEFAKRISTSRTNAYDIFNRLSIDMELLERISKVLHRNFFAEMAQQMKLQLEMSPEKATMANAKLESLVHPLEKELDGTVYSEATFAKDREGLKALLKEYFESDHRIPLIILETGYTFGAREVVKQVAGEVYHSAGSAPCPKVLDASRVKSMPAKVFVEYIDCNTFDSVDVSDERLNEICRIQGDVNKKFVCIIHTDPIVSLPGKGATKSFDQWGSEMSIFLSRSEQFFISVYRWNRNSLLSWATDAGLHEYVINYIRKHHNVILLGPTGSGKTYIGCALGVSAVRNFMKVKYVRLPELLTELAIARASNTFPKVIQQYQKITLLIMDEWLLYPLKETETRDILEIIEARYQHASTIFCSQFDVPGWHDKFSSPLKGFEGSRFIRLGSFPSSHSVFFHTYLFSSYTVLQP